MRELNLDITDNKANEIIEILEDYPRGHLEIKFERVFWVSNSLEAQSRDNPANLPPGDRRDSLLKQPTVGDRFQKMSDTLGSMMGPPQRQEPRRRY